MSRLIRILLVGTAFAVLVAGGALAGPGDRTSSGDPEVPMGTQPRGHTSRELADASATGSAALRGEVVDVRGDSLRLRVLEAVLELARVFVLR